MSYDFYSPTGVANEALSASGVDLMLGDIQEGTDLANACLRHYYPALSQLLRTAGWNFARKFAPLTLVADATGQTANVGTSVPTTAFLYAYAYPTDCAFLRYIPWNPEITPPVPATNIVPPDFSSPLVDGLNTQNAVPMGQIPARFLVSGDLNNLEEGASNVGVGSSPISRTVICTNVRSAKAIYTFNATYPNLWSSQFREAMVAYLAALIVLKVNPDKKMGMTLRGQNIAIAKERIKAARVSEGKESWSSSDLSVDWMRFRNSGGGRWNAWGLNSGVGDWSCNYGDIGWGTGNSSAY